MTEYARPIDTRKIIVPTELEQLTERLAANVHQHWMQQRIADGWRPGPRRNQETKETPLLVPYEQLSEEEKLYDRITAMETVKAILALGFTITSPAPGGSPEELAEELLQKWQCCGSISELLSARRYVQEQNITDPRAYRILAQQLLRKGEPLIAYDIACDGLKLAKGDVRLQQLQALALARGGATAPANRILTALWDSGHTDPETSGLLARTHKDLWLSLCERCEGADHLKKANDLYQRGYESALGKGDIDGGIYNGINAASTALLMGDTAAAAKYAAEVAELCDKRDPPDYWSLASKAEALLVRGEFDAAEQVYREAGRDDKVSAGDLSATRKQARLLLRALGRDSGDLDHCFPLTAIRIVRIDLRRCRNKQFDELRRQTDQAIAGKKRHFAYVCVLSHHDLAIVEGMLNGGHEVHVVLPVPLDIPAVATALGVPPERLKAILEGCASVLVASGLRAKSSRVNCHYAELLRDGSALLHAQALDAHWAMVDLVCDEDGMRLEPAEVKSSTDSMAIGESADRAPERIRGILFADAVHFSRLNEDQVEIFSKEFLGAIADLIDGTMHKPLTRNTWGDGLYFVFKELSDAGEFALELREKITGTDWSTKGLPKELSLRIALHAGPVFKIMDPVTQQDVFTGVHVSRGARIEPITPPGEVYASENFAAIAAAQKIADFRCEYVGQLPLAKGYGTFGIYHVRGRESGG